MEMLINQSELQYKKCVSRDIRNQEESQEVKLTDGMPEIGRIIATWGQCLLRSKEWQGNDVCITGGVAARVLYQPEDESSPVCMESWIPFQMRWMLPETQMEGTLRAACMLRSIDARPVSARRMILRVNVAVMTEAIEPSRQALIQPETVDDDVQLLRNTYPIQLVKEVGETSFLLDDEVSLVTYCPDFQRLIACDLHPEIAEKRVIGQRAVFRGNGRLHVVYLGKEDRVYSCDVEIPFSQFVELDAEYGADADINIIPAVTSLELEPVDDQKLRLKCGIAAQYVIDDRILLELIEDAYSPVRNVEVTNSEINLSTVLEKKTEQMRMEIDMPDVFGDAADVRLFSDYPQLITDGGRTSIQIPCSVQVVYYDKEGKLQSELTRWEEKKEFTLADNARIHAMLLPNGQSTTSIGADGMKVRMDCNIDMTTIADYDIRTVSGLETSGEKEPDAQRPALILRRVDDGGLWNLAKNCGSTIAAIKQANQLQGEPISGQMLLIPVL